MPPSPPPTHEEDLVLLAARSENAAAAALWLSGRFKCRVGFAGSPADLAALCADVAATGTEREITLAGGAHARCVPVASAEGGVLGALCVAGGDGDGWALRITARQIAIQLGARDASRRREEAIVAAREASEVLSRVLDTAPIAIIASDFDRKIRIWNRAAEVLYGWTALEVLGEPFKAVLPERRDEHEAIAARVRSGERIDRLETIHRRKDGTEVPVSLSVAALPVRPAGAAVPYIVAAVEDVSEHRRLVRALHESKRELRAVIDGVDVALCRIAFRDTSQGVPLFFGRRAEALFGIDHAEIEDDTAKWWDAVDPEDVPSLQRWLAEMRRTGEARTQLFRFRHGKTGEWRMIEAHATPRLSPDGELEEIFGACRDVTEGKRVEAALARAREDQKQLASLLVHDFKSPLSTMLANVRFVEREDGLSDDAKEALSDARNAADALGQMVMNLLDISRAEDGELVAVRAPVSLGRLLGDACSEARHRLRERDQHAELLVSGDIDAQIDAGLVRRIVDNLLDNCMKYGGTGSRISVSASSDGGHVRIVVADEGPGIPPDMRERIFDKSVRLDRDSEKHARTSRGLGLTFCRLAARAHGGDVRVEPNEPKGARFVVALPRSAGTSDAPPLAPARLDGGAA